jgi:hypothetical protein
MSSENERSLRDELTENLQESQERMRDEVGRFAKPDEAPIDPVAEDVLVDADPPADEVVKPERVKTGKEATATKPDEDAFPASWKKDVAKHWEKVPKEVRQYIRQHEEQTRIAMTKQDEDRLTGKSVREVVTPYMAMIQAEGGTIQTAMQNLLNQAYILRRGTPEQKRALVMGAIKTYGIDVSEPASTQQGWVDPQVSALQQKLAELEGWKQQQTQQAQYQETASINGQIQQFGSDPKHEHFKNSKVQSMMGALLMNGQAQSMEDAYEQSIWAIPELRSTLITSQQSADQAKRAAEARAKATAARNASGSVRGSSSGLSGSQAVAPKGSLREELQAAFAASKDR